MSKISENKEKVFSLLDGQSIIFIELAELYLYQEATETESNAEIEKPESKNPQKSKKIKKIKSTQLVHRLRKRSHHFHHHRHRQRRRRLQNR